MKTKILDLLFLVFLTSCYYKITNYPSLVNQGILPVSKEQAYVGANLFLSREMEQSTFLYNFLKKRGAPDAICFDSISNFLTSEISSFSLSTFLLTKYKISCIEPRVTNVLLLIGFNKLLLIAIFKIFE